MSDNIPHHWKDSVCLNCGEAGSFDGPCLSRASNAALKAENEALKTDITGMGYDNDSMRHSIANFQRGRQAALDQVAELERELKDTQEQLASFVDGKLWHSDATCAARNKQLASFLNWQPSDPGTKEAMEWAAFLENMFRCQPERRPTKDEANLIVLAHSHRAAMVRLEEAEKELSKCGGKNCMGLAVEGVRSWVSKESLIAAESQVAALTASLASMTKERDEYYSWWQAQKQTIKSHAESHDEVLAELAELRKQLDERKP